MLGVTIGDPVTPKTQGMTPQASGTQRTRDFGWRIHQEMPGRLSTLDGEGWRVTTDLRGLDINGFSRSAGSSFHDGLGKCRVSVNGFQNLLIGRFEVLGDA